MIIRKSWDELKILNHANWIVQETLSVLKKNVVPDISTGELDSLAEETLRKHDGKPAFKGYRGFPAATCISINDEVVHGIPSKKRVLKEGDIVSIDIGVIYDGYIGDSAETIPVGNVSQKAERLIATTRNALMEAVDEIQEGARLSNISNVIQDYAESRGYSVVRDFAGHGVGTALHEEPQIPNYGPRGIGPVLREGMVLAIEPMLNTGDWRVYIGRDNWTVRTVDGGLSAHFELSVAVTGNGPWILGKEKENKKTQ